MRLKTSYLSVIFLIALTVNTTSAQPGRWEPPVNISNNAGGSTSPDMAIGPDGKIHVVWEDYTRLGSLFWKDILYAYYDGIEWSEPEQVSAMDTTYSFDPAVAVDSLGRPHVVWNHRAIFPDADAYYSYKTATGWTEPLNLAPHGGTQYHPDISIDSRGFIHVVWADYWPGNGDIYHKYYDGVAWSDYFNVSNDPIDSGKPDLTVDSQNNLHVTWQQYYGGGISCEIYYSFFNGIIWSLKENISQNSNLDSVQPSIATDIEYNPHVVWKQSIGGNYSEIGYSYFNGYNWSPPEHIFDLGNSSIKPAIVINEDNVSCVLFSYQIQNESPRVIYTFCRNSQWSTPDSIYDFISSTEPAIDTDNFGFFHSCMPCGFCAYGDIGYTFYYIPSWVDERDDLHFNNNISLQCFPNPFNSTLNIRFFSLNQACLELSIINNNGQLIEKLINNSILSGENNIIWHLNEAKTSEISSGVYHVVLKVDDEIINQKVILIK